jgi:hypothetical protein
VHKFTEDKMPARFFVVATNQRRRRQSADALGTPEAEMPRPGIRAAAFQPLGA